MDPLQALLEAERHLRDGELVEAQATLERYWQWRQAGGAEPAGGDVLASHLRRRIASRQPERPEDRGPTPLADCLDELCRQHRPQPDDTDDTNVGGTGE